MTGGLGAFDLVIFDWAGTMVDFGCRAPIAALVEAFARHGVILDEATARADMGKAKVDHVHALLAMTDVSAAWMAANGAPPVLERWTGTYASAPDSTVVDTPAPGVRLVMVTTGAGASTGFALGEEVVAELFEGASE